MENSSVQTCTNTKQQELIFCKIKNKNVFSLIKVLIDIKEIDFYLYSDFKIL